MMKKLIFIIIIFVFLIQQVVNSQIIRDKGIKIAITSSNIQVEQFPSDFSRRLGFNIGLFLESIKIHNLLLVTQIEYNQKGFIDKAIWTDENENIVGEAKANYRLDYLTIPIFIKYRHENFHFKPFLSAGPRIDFLINKKNGIYEHPSGSIKGFFADYFKNFVIGTSVSAGFEITKLLPLKTSIEIRYNIDFTESSKHTDFIKLKNKSFDLWLGFFF
jgi:hypothetical protein